MEARQGRYGKIYGGAHTIGREVLKDHILSRFRAVLTQAYGDRLDRVVLFGSRARGDSRPDSDYDVAVLIQDPGTRCDEIMRLARLRADKMIDTGGVISAKPFTAGADKKASQLMREIQRDGVAF